MNKLLFYELSRIQVAFALLSSHSVRTYIAHRIPIKLKYIRILHCVFPENQKVPSEKAHSQGGVFSLVKFCAACLKKHKFGQRFN